MSNNGPCDISASQTNSIIQQRLNYIQSAAITHPPGYGFPYVAPQRTQLNCISMNLINADLYQANYKKTVLSSKNNNSFVASKQTQFNRIISGYSASGQKSTQFATQNWTYTSSNTRNTPQFENNTIACQTTIGQQNWFSVTVNSTGNKFVAVTVTGNVYYSTNGSIWNTSLLSGIEIGPRPFIAQSQNSNSLVLTGSKDIYYSSDSGTTWISISSTEQIQPVDYYGIVISNEGYNSIYTSNQLNNDGTTMISLKVQLSPSLSTIANNLSPFLPILKIPFSNYVRFTAITSGQISNNIATSMDRIYACGYVNPSYIGNLAPQPPGGSYVWKSDTSGNNWLNGTSPYGSNNLPGNSGTDISLSVIATDYSGNRVVVAGSNINYRTQQNLFISDNSGAVWSSYNFANGSNIAYNWYAIAMSGNSKVIVASSAENTGLGGTGFIYVSTNGGTIGTKTSCPEAIWYSISISYNGNTIIAVSNSIRDGISLLSGGYIFISFDAGSTWKQSNTLTA